MTSKISTRQIIILVVYGIVLWFLAAMLVRTLGPLGALNGYKGAVTFALVIPGTIPALIFARKMAKLARSQITAGIAIVTATALLLDGIAHAWFPALYGSDPLLIIKGAAAIFWGAGVGLVLALIMEESEVA
jgi:hypothetical protein